MSQLPLTLSGVTPCSCIETFIAHLFCALLRPNTKIGAEEAIVYGMPTLKYQGKPFLGFDAHTHHIGIYPYSGQVVETLQDQLHGYSFSKGAIRVPLDHPISEEMLKQIIHLRLKEITPS